MFPIIPANSVTAPSGNQEGIFGFGLYGSVTAVTNLVSNVGVVASDTAGVGTARREPAATQYGGDKAIFAFGDDSTGSPTARNVVSMSNLVSNAGVVASDTAGVGTARNQLAAATYGEDKGIFGFGKNASHSYVGMTNLVNNSGDVASDTAIVAGVTARGEILGACEYGTDKAIFAYGYGGSAVQSVSNLVSNAGVVASDTAGVGTARYSIAACSYGGDKGIFGFGYNDVSLLGVTNLVTNLGVVGNDVAAVEAVRMGASACEYGGDKGIFGYGNGVAETNLVDNAGVVASDVTQVGTANENRAACSFN